MPSPESVPEPPDAEETAGGAYDQDEVELVAERLRALGYIE